MRLPDKMPAPVRMGRRAREYRSPSTGGAAEQGVSPAACCAEVCVNVPFVGRVCHCTLELPICP